MGEKVNKCYSWVHKKLANKRDLPYLEKIPFSMMKSIIICIYLNPFMCIHLNQLISHQWEKHTVKELVTYSDARWNIAWLINEKLWKI